MSHPESVYMSESTLLALPEYGLLSGDNRGRGSSLTANSDGEALAAWLATFHGSPNTLRSARKEVERLWMWAAEERGKSVSALTHEDMLAYQAFLADPQPASRWVASGHYSREHPDWRPFARRKPGQPPLSSASQRQALVILDGCFRWLVEAGYLLHNPLHLSRRSWSKTRIKAAEMPPASLDATASGRWLTPEEWAVIGTVIEDMPRETMKELEHYSRCRWVMALLYLAKLRISEVARATMGRFYAQQYNGKERWWLIIRGKGDKVRKVAVPLDLLAELTAYRESCGLPPWPSPTETTPLVGKFRKSTRHPDSISVSTLNNIVKEVFANAASYARLQGNPGLALRLEQASAHWLRHSGASHLLHAGVDMVKVRDQLGHSSISTTNTYLHSEDLQRHDDISHYHKLGWKSKT